MSKLTFGGAAAVVMSVAWPAYGQDGRIAAEQPFTLDQSLRKEIVANAEFTSGIQEGHLRRHRARRHARNHLSE
jgi:hypothetical protein